MELPVSEKARTIKSYVLRAGRMSPAQKRCYDSLFPRFGVPVSACGGQFDFREIFGNSNPVIAEIGFGMGLATALMAEKNPGKNWLGIEVFRPGIGRLLYEIEKRGLSNIRIVEHDAAEVFSALVPDHSLQGIHVFFPDPWPKKRHHKRRLINRPFTDLLARKLRPRGEGDSGERPWFYMVTDWEDYALKALRALSETPGFVNPLPRHQGGNAGEEGFAPPRPWRPRTKFEQKGTAQNHSIRELYFEVSHVRE